MRSGNFPDRAMPLSVAENRKSALQLALTFIGALAMFAAAAGPTPAPDDGFAAETYDGSRGLALPYRLFVPDTRLRTQPLPLIIFLHGAAGAGVDNLRQLQGGNFQGSHIWITPVAQAQQPAYVIAPQIPPDNAWAASNTSQLSPYAELVLDLLSDLERKYSIDTDRIYVVGQSLGGMGVWDLISKRPNVFAAAVSVCGSGDVATVSAAKSVPVWAFHGAKDEVVPVGGSREMVAALKAVGGTVKYTEYPNGQHDVWTIAFADPELFQWLFAQKRSPHPTNNGRTH
jgi:predicted peptidase